VKPSLFKNELLATSDPLNTWIFEGLWCIADRDGRLEDRPRRIHLEINPGRAYEGTEASLAWLSEQGFILRYKHSGSDYIQIVNFAKHQSPHFKEPASKIPAPSIRPSEAPDCDDNMSATEPETSTGQEPGSPQSSRADSGLLIPDSSDSGLRKPEARAVDAEFVERFAEFKALYPKRSGDQRWPSAEKHIRARLREGFTWNDILDGVKRYAQWVRAAGKEGTETVKQAATFVGTDKGFVEAFEIPKNGNGNGTYQQKPTRLERAKQALDEYCVANGVDPASV
jgi:hypothetical protein